MADTMTLLGTATVSGTSTYSVTFNNISQGYTDLKIVMSQKTNRNDVFQGQVIYFNGSSVGSTQVLQANGSATVTANTQSATIIQNAEGNDATTANIYGMIELYIGGYSQQGIYKSAYAQSVAEANATTVYNTINYLDNGSITDPITSVKIESGNLSYALLAGSEYYLYGVFNQDVAAAPSVPTIGTATIPSAGGYVNVAFTGVSGAASYTATSSPGGITATGTSSPIRVPVGTGGLTSGTAYTFTVKASNPFGSSGNSSASNSVTAVNTTIVAMPNGSSTTGKYSQNAGVSWTSFTMPAGSNAQSLGAGSNITYGNGYFVYIPNTTNNAYYSANGYSSWTSVALPYTSFQATILQYTPGNG